MKNIERPVRVTHLICFNSSRGSPPQPSDENVSAEEEIEEIRETSDKLKYAEKFNSRKEADIQIVWEDWFWDCLASGGRWDESYYKVGVVTKARTKKLSEERSKKKGIFTHDLLREVCSHLFLCYSVTGCSCKCFPSESSHV